MTFHWMDAMTGFAFGIAAGFIGCLALEYWGGFLS